MTAFISDNVSGIHPAILGAITQANLDAEVPYGIEQWPVKSNAAFADLFETEVLAIPCTSGTAANCLALSLMLELVVSICVHQKFISILWMKSWPLSSLRRRQTQPFNQRWFKGRCRHFSVGYEHHWRHAFSSPGALRLTQSSETGPICSIEEDKKLTEVVSNKGLKTPMDGAGLTNAVDALNCSPVELTWKDGVDFLSFGATKNGVMTAEAVVLFKPNLFKSAP
ncbi:MAG: threonine aldolase [Gammaproteobacteria bacterium]|jgi:threonine aldolase